MKSIFTFSVCFLFSVQVFSQVTGDIYGLNFTSNTLKLAQLNPEDGTVNLVNENSLSGDQFASGNSDLDPNLGRYHYVRFGQMITADIETGEVLFSPPLTCATLELNQVAPIMNIAYNWLDSTIYGLVHVEDMLYFSKVDPQTGVIDVLSDGPITQDSFSSGVSDIDPISGRYFFIRSNKVVTVNIYTGELIAQETIENPNEAVAPITNIAYNWLTGTIYGLNFVAGSQNGNIITSPQLRLASVDPENGELIILSDEVLSSDGFSSGVSDIDPVNGVYYYIRGSRIYTVDIATGDLIGNFVLSNPNNAIEPITNIAVYKDKNTQPAPISSFDANDEDLSVFFKNTSRHNLHAYWEFGDGNSSTERHVSHTFAETGTYEVMLVSESMGGELDTTYQTISVEGTSLSLDDLDQTQLLIYPNPAPERVWIETENEMPGASLRIFSVDGKMVFEEIIATNLIELNVADYKAGVYLIKVVAKNGSVNSSSKLVIKP